MFDPNKHKLSWKDTSTHNKIQAVMIIVLVIITLWYAISTSSMVSIMKEDFDLNNRPWVYFKPMEFNTDMEEIPVNLVLTNTGKVPAEGFVKNITYFLCGEDYSFNEPIAFVLFPNEEKVGIYAGFINRSTGFNWLVYNQCEGDLIVGATIIYTTPGKNSEFITEGYYRVSFEFVSEEMIKQNIDLLDFKLE
jgi:hypothetical protein